MEQILEMIKDKRVRMLILDCLVSRSFTLKDPSSPIIIALANLIQESLKEVKLNNVV